MRLNEIQARFKDSLLEEALPEPDTDFAALFRDGNIAVSDRLAVYRNNLFAGLAEVIVNTYPLLEKLVGEAFLRAVARRYIARHLPASGNLNLYGGGLAAFLKDYKPAKGLPYLPDVARLEWACHEVYHARDEVPLDPASLSGMRDFNRLRFRFRDSARLISSPYPLHEIRAFCLADPAPEGTLELDAGPSFLLVTRPALEAEVEAIPPDVFSFYESLQSGANLAAAAEKAGVANGFDLADALQHAFAKQILSPSDI